VRLYLQNSDDEEDINDTLQSSPYLFGYVKFKMRYHQTKDTSPKQLLSCNIPVFSNIVIFSKTQYYIAQNFGRSTRPWILVEKTLVNGDNKPFLLVRTELIVAWLHGDDIYLHFSVK